jgi:rhodanese-related sulfurtransferase
MTKRIDARTLDAWLHDGKELALLDVREQGQIGEGQLLWAVAAPYSRFERDLPRLAPNPAVRMVLLDEEDDLAARAANRARALGYRNLSILEGGIAAWTAGGGTLFKGVNVPGKLFGECVEHALATPSISAEDLAARLAGGEDLVVIDGRPVEEYRKMNIPGSLCCPNGELPYRIGGMVPDPATTVVINCAGRTRSILGTEILRSVGLANPVLALQNGTMGWQLSGQRLEHGAGRLYGDGVSGEALAALRSRARSLAERTGVGRLSAEQAIGWLSDRARTTFLLDVRTAEDYAADHLTGARHAPGGQLLQATDRWIGVREARLLLLDDDGERAPIIAAWLVRAGWEAAVLTEGRHAWPRLAAHRSAPPTFSPPPLGAIGAADILRLPRGALLLDLRSSLDFRDGHLAGAQWSIRPRLGQALSNHPKGTPVVLIASQPAIAELAALDIVEAGYPTPLLLSDSPELWKQAGLTTEASPAIPPDLEAIDHLFFVHDRHAGNLDAARQYLAWETGLLEQLDDEDRKRLAARLH